MSHSWCPPLHSSIESEVIHSSEHKKRKGKNRRIMLKSSFHVPFRSSIGRLFLLWIAMRDLGPFSVRVQGFCHQKPLAMFTFLSCWQPEEGDGVSFVWKRPCFLGFSGCPCPPKLLRWVLLSVLAHVSSWRCVLLPSCCTTMF